MRKLIVLSMGLALAVCIAGLGVARAADMDNETYDKVFKCWESSNKCVEKCHSEPSCDKPKCDTCGKCKQQTCTKCEKKCDTCKPKCDTCEPEKPKCDTCKPCKPKCKQDTCTKVCEEPKELCCPQMPCEYPNPCGPVVLGEFDRDGLSRKNA